MKATNSKGKDGFAAANGGATLASSVYDRIRDDILSGRLNPGEKLRAEFLRDRYTVGNSPVREALNRLSADGLVVREDQKGFHVATVSKKDLLELIKTRCWLEEIALRETIAQGGTVWEERLVLAYHRLSRVPRSSSEVAYAINPDWEHFHREFHATLISSCGSRWLQGFCAQLNDQAIRYRHLAIAVSFPERDTLAEHRAIMEASIDGDADAAARLLREHYHRTADILLTAEHHFTDAAPPA